MITHPAISFCEMCGAFKGDKSEKYGFKELRTFLTTKPILITFISSLIYGIGTQIQSGANAYFYTYIMGDLTLLSGVSGMAIVGMVPAMVLSPIIANKIGKKKVYVMGLIIAVTGFAVRLLNITALPLLYVSAILVSLGSGFTTTLMYGIQADNTTYVQYKTGKRAEAAVASLSSFISKVGQGIAGALPGYVLAATGFVANAAQQNASVTGGIIACVIVIPMVRW